MADEGLLSFYSRRNEDFSRRAGMVTKKINLVSHARLAVALTFVITIFFGFRDPVLLYALPLLAAFFIVLMRNHGGLFAEREHLENLGSINRNERDALMGKNEALHDGAEFTDVHHAYSHDLDLFGVGSLFHHLNRCNTLSGRKKFAGRLSNPLTSAEDIRLNQSAIGELSGQTEYRHHFQAAGLAIDEQPGDREQLLKWIGHRPFFYGKGINRLILLLVPAVTIALIAAAFFSTAFRPFAILMAALQWGYVGIYMKKINDFHAFISRKAVILRKYSRLLHFLKSHRFSSPLMERISGDARNADEKLEQLASAVHAFDARLNSMTMLFVNSILLYDLQCVYRLEKWKEENASRFAVWLEAVSEAEVLCSFGTFAFNNPDFAFAGITPGLSLSASSMGHPLIPAPERVVNDFRMGGDHKILIVTGANMAGKSTFLRTVGVNLVLALNGAPVCARQFHAPIISLHTGMRTADSLKDHQSYFYAELDRLQTIMEALRRDIPLLVLLDEILKGTNSSDKQAGSIALVRQLLPHPCLAVIATHDLALGDLERQFPDQIRNYCFEANIDNDQLSFDYKLKPGLATKMNATFLMKKMGIIPR